MSQSGAPGGLHSPLSGRHLLVAYACVLLAVATMWNRNALPAWMRVEFMGQDDMVARYSTLQVRPRYTVSEISLTGKPTLVVGDSLVSNWPWDADKVCIFAVGASSLADQLAHYLPGRRYEQIVLWPGTAHFRAGGTVETYLAGTERMVALAREHSDRVYVIAPMPYDAPSWRAARLRAATDAARRGERAPDLSEYVDDTMTVVAEATARLRERLPQTPVYEPAGFRTAAIEQGRLWELFSDGVHLRAAGYQAVGPELRNLGILLPRADAGGS